MMHPKKRESPERADGYLASPPLPASPIPRPTSPSTSHVYIQTLPPHAQWHAQSLGGYSSSRTDLNSQEPRPLHMIDPTVTLTSQDQSVCRTFFRVYKDQHLVHEEPAPMRLAATGQQTLAGGPMYLYTTSLVPSYWARLCAAEGICVPFNRYEIALIIVSGRPRSVHNLPRSRSHVLVVARLACFALSHLPLRRQLSRIPALVPALQLRVGGPAAISR